MKVKLDYSLYLVTDRGMLAGATLADAVDRAIRGGCTLVQLREKEASSRAFYEVARTVKEITDRHGVPLIINDRADLAVAVDAAGVHVGQDDLPPGAVRDIVGPRRIVGVSAANLAEAEAAAAAGADYLGVGAMFATDTKADADLTTFDELRRIRAAVSLPIVVIGGINLKTIPRFEGFGVDGFAVVSAILAQPDVEGAARELARVIGRCS